MLIGYWKGFGVVVNGEGMFVGVLWYGCKIIVFLVFVYKLVINLVVDDCDVIVCF